jgi:hypothetical protein
MRLDAMVNESVANYGQYTGEVVGLGHGRVDRVLEMQVVPLDGFKNAYTRKPMINAYKIHEGTKVRSFVYVVPIEESDGREQRMLVGCDGEDLDIATFFRPIGINAPTGDVYVAMPSKAFAGDGDEVQYAFRVRNYLQLSNETLVLVDDLQIGMEFTTNTQRKHADRGVMLIKNNQTFSRQLGELGDKQRGFKMQFVEQTKMADEAPEHSKAVLQTQVFGFVASPPTAEQILSKAMERHFYYYQGREGRHVATQSRGTRSMGGKTKGGTSLSHAKLVAGELTNWNVSVSEAVPIAERAKVELCLMVGDVARIFHEKHVEAAVPVAPVALPDVHVECKFDGFMESMRCIARMLRASHHETERKQLQELSDVMCCWPVSSTDSTALAVAVIECEDKDDEEGQALHMTSGNLGQRLYTAQVGTLLRVRVTNFSLCGASIELQPVYYSTVLTKRGRVEHVEEEESPITLAAGDAYDLPFPLQKQPGEDVDGWLLKDGGGKVVMQVLFVLSSQSLAEFREEQERKERERQEREEKEKKVREEREREERECAMLLDSAAQATASDLPLGDTVVVECCVCLDKKLMRQMALFKPCGHCVCCSECYTKQVEMDTAAGKRSKCPKCRTVVADVMRVFF